MANLPFGSSPDGQRRWWARASRPALTVADGMGFAEAEHKRTRRRNVTLAALLLVLAVAMTMFVALLVQLRIDRLPLAMSRFQSMRSDMQGLDTALRSMGANGHVFATMGQGGLAAEFETSASSAGTRLERLAKAFCAQTGPSSIHRKQLDDLAQEVSGYAARGRQVLGAGAAPLPKGDTQLDRIKDQLQELERSAHECFRVEVDDIWLRAKRIKLQAETLLVLIAFTVLAILLLRRSDQAQLRDQLRFNEQLIDAIPLPLSLRSPQGRFMLVNQAFEEKHKVSRADLIGRPVRDTMPKADAEAIAMMDARATASIEPVEGDFHIVDQDVDRHVMVRLHALRRADSSVRGIVSVQTDVTALRRKEAQLVEINAKLGKLSVRMIDAQEDERRRIARDLHDQVGQILTALKLQLASMARLERIEKPAAALELPIDLAEEALRHTRDLSASLHPHLLDDLGIEPALNWLIERFIRPSVPQIELRCRLEPARGPAASELVAFRVVQEALTNVVRHAGATRVGVFLEGGNGEIAIEVIDDGVGFDAGVTWFDLQRSTSLGVTSMRDRVTELGGELHMDSTPGTGTSLRVRLPWANQSH
jgi:PAS domain S-box-containing protein